MGIETYRLLVVEDHSVFLKGLTHLISTEPGMVIVGEATSRHAALGCLDTARPDVVLVDLSLGDDNGLELIKDLRFRRPDLKILVLSMHDERYYADRAVAAGALGYCMKEEAVEHLLEALHHVCQGKGWRSARLDDKISALKAQGGHRPGVLALSDREFEIFNLIGVGLGTGEIAGRLCLSAKTVDTHKENLKSKLNLATSLDLRQFAIRWQSEERA